MLPRGYAADAAMSMGTSNHRVMPYTLTLDCGCTVYVDAESSRSQTPTRVLQARAPACQVRGHRVGVRVWLWELLPEPARVSATRRARRAVSSS